ncbi:O-antigen ligase family protein [Halorhodospira abdelmalekii]|uniref:O-antigen ligase family protein n=1 Tax=Halorhodospira abdelmalekii TaxID=421629 RepID=UPI001903F8B6
MNIIARDPHELHCFLTKQEKTSLLLFLASSILYFYSPAIGLWTFLLFLLHAAHSARTFLVLIIPLIILTRHHEPAEVLPFSDGHLLTLFMVLATLPFLYRVSRIPRDPATLFFLMFLFSYTLTNIINLGVSTHLEPTRHIFGTLAFLGISATSLYILYSRTPSFSLFSSPWPLILCAVAALAILLYHAHLYHDWFRGGSLTIRLSETSTRNTATALVLVFIALYWATLRQWRNNIIAWITLAALAIGIFASGSRITPIALVAGILIPHALSIARRLLADRLVRPSRIIIFLCATITTSALLAFFTPALETLDELNWRVLRDPTTTAQTRLEIWDRLVASLDVKTFLLGSGAGSATSIIGSHPHSGFFSLLYSNGVFTLTTFLTLLLVITTRAIKANDCATQGLVFGLATFLLIGIQTDRVDFILCLVFTLVFYYSFQRRYSTTKPPTGY